jgi:hypothetical protein
MDYRVVRTYEEIRNPGINAAILISGTPAIRTHDPEQKWKTVRTPTFKNPLIFLLIKQVGTQAYRGPLWAADWGFEKLAGYCLRCLRLDKFSQCDDTYKCHACERVRYCSAIHRIYDWNRHKNCCEEINLEWNTADRDTMDLVLGGKRDKEQTRDLRPDCELCYEKPRDPERARQLLRGWCESKERGLCGKSEN